MTARALDGKMLAKKIKDKLREEVVTFSLRPSLHVILVGDEKASARYVAYKEKACQEVGIESYCHRLSADTSQVELIELIEKLNADKKVHGILLQLPLPKKIRVGDVIELIDPQKDVDGFHPYNLGRLMQRRPALRPCTPYGVIQLLKETGENLSGKVALVVGASNIVGRPMVMELLLEKCTVVVAHRFTKNLEALVSQADILISAIGKPGVLQSEWIKSGAIVIDVGINEDENGRLIGDLDYEAAEKEPVGLHQFPVV
jgi:methylenetetrahydrofolate dehydrogenase (NADP+)/methenyltetrahydrofolate cyclohydrolase